MEYSRIIYPKQTCFAPCDFSTFDIHYNNEFNLNNIKKEAFKCNMRKCEICNFKFCTTMTLKKIPPTGYGGYEIYEEKKYKNLCCRCTQVMDAIIYGETSDHEQCKTCLLSTRKCCKCGFDNCDTLTDFNIGYESHGDEDGFYCCLCVEYSRTFNDDRFVVCECDSCKKFKKEKGEEI